MALARGTILRFLSTTAKRSHINIPITCISSARQFSTSPCMEPTSNSTLEDLQSQLQSSKEELEALRKAKLDRLSPVKEEEVVVVKEKDPLLKKLESEMSKANKLPDGFKHTSDYDGESYFDLKVQQMKETIRLIVKKPYNAYRNINFPLTIKVSSSRFLFPASTEIYCTLTQNGYRIDDRCNDHTIIPDFIFSQLPEDLKSELYNYFEIRGLHCSSAKHLFEYMVTKTYRENLEAFGIFNKILNEE